ncbi:MAG: WhiB family transcriptional regulator [bacterium]
MITLDWQLRAVCRNVDPDLFFPISNLDASQEQIEEAKAICGVCDVREHCLRSSVESGEQFGIWGGLTEDERKPILRTYLKSSITPRPRCLICDRIRPIHRYGLCKACHSGQQDRGRLHVWAERTKAGVS